MRKILLLTFIGGLGFSTQMHNTLNVIAHSIGSRYLHGNYNSVCITSCAALPCESFAVSEFAPMIVYVKTVFKNVSGSHLPATKVFPDKNFLLASTTSSTGLAVFTQQNTSTIATLHFHRMVNRKRILLSG